MKYDFLFLSINSSNLAHYLDSGLILSANRYDNRILDIQSSISDNILLSKKESYLSDSDMILKIKNIDQNLMLQSDIENLFFYQQPIPLYAIEKIITTRDVNELLSTIKIGNVGFVDFSKFEKGTLNKQEASMTIKNNGYQYDDTILSKIKHYDALLGGYALYHSSIDKSSPEDYLSLVSKLKENNILVSQKITLEGFAKFIQEEDVKEIAKNEHIPIDGLFRNGLYKFNLLSKKDSKSYIFMVLFNYLNKKNTDSFIYDINNKKDQFEASSLTNIIVSYGFYQGYSAVKARYDDVNIKLSLPKDSYIFSYLFDFIFNPNNEVQSSDNIFKRTEEQLDIINISKTMQTGQVLIVDALAGCTKTSTLEMITTDNPNSSFLYLAFNKKIVEEAKRRFPKNTEVRTLHALAYKYEVKNKSLVEENYFDRIIADEFKVSVSKDRYLINDIKKEYRHFCLSEYSINELDKFVKERKKEIKNFYEHKKQDRSEYFIGRLLDSVEYIEKIWNYMCGSNITTHDTYLKMFVENMDTYAINYDFVVLDEAQDVSRLLGKFIINSILSGKYKVIIVGDNNQKIYGFLGNVSLSRIIRRILDNSVYIDKNLTRTFRFSPDTPIENNTNLILNMRNISIIGAKPITNDALDHIESQAFLSRSKMAVLNKATELIEKGADFNLFMEKSDFDIDVIIDLYDLYRYTMIMKKVLIEKNKLEKDDLAKIDTIPRVKTKFFDIKTGKTYQDYVIKKVINIFRENKDNTIIPAFKNKKFNEISSIYELEYGAQENMVSDDLENLKICYFVIARFNFFNDFHSNIQYAHIVDKTLSILLEEKSNKKSTAFISTIHKVKGLEFEEVTLIDSVTIVRETNPSIDDDHIKIKGGTKGIIGLCDESEKNCKCIQHVGDENKEEKSVSEIIENYKKKTITARHGIDFSNIDEAKKISLEEIKESANDIEAVNKFLCFNVNEENIQEEYNILYVGITRAEKIINISNGKYRDTLRFLSFIKENKNEIYNIVNNRESDLLVYNKIKKTNGIIFNSNNDQTINKDSVFIAKRCLKEFIASFENYS